MSWTTRALALSLLFPTSAFATRALVIQDSMPLGYDSLTVELTNQGIDYDVVGSAGLITLSSVDLLDYHMVFVSECQTDTLYQALNADMVRYEAFVGSGGHLFYHASDCGTYSTTPFREFPGGALQTVQGVWVNQGWVALGGHPLSANVNTIFFGSPAALDWVDSSTVNPSDKLVIYDDQFLEPILVQRFYGDGIAVFGTLLVSFGFAIGEEAGEVLKNEVFYALGSACPDVDGDGVCNPEDPCPLDFFGDSDIDGICDSDDVCPGGNDNLDTDGDTIPNDCDTCPAGDDLLDFDDDGVPDACDPCPTIPYEEDLDGDGYPTCVDCEDGDGDIFVGADELVADGVDQDCDGADLCYDDGDGDGYGNPNEFVVGNDLGCTGPGESDNGEDCDDDDPSTYPGAVEIDFDGVDQDCDGDPGLEGDVDSDGDGIMDADELALGSDPNQADSDGDGVPDGTEVGDVQSPLDTDGDGILDLLDQDDDGDGWDTIAEGTDDLDGDGLPNYLDLDSDGDGASDASESAEGLYESGGGDEVSEKPPGSPGTYGCGCSSALPASPAGWGAFVALLGVLLRSRRSSVLRD